MTENRVSPQALTIIILTRQAFYPNRPVRGQIADWLPGGDTPPPCLPVHPSISITHQLQRPSTNAVTMVPTDGNFLWSCPVIGGETSKQRTAGPTVYREENYILSTPEGDISQTSRPQDFFMAKV
ncbi:uncharacterized protein AKAME5_001907000 [Lates japonicus]|uniref:Uncharacterized protein n=1 Tax=Lates japonicus TaxID=270547 RepID=A0AAD3RGP9_LATJO|nr:uncharacterized protein AKAME5_001907000 [Lates japonicus]